jgi:hypothetical protein
MLCIEQSQPSLRAAGLRFTFIADVRIRATQAFPTPLCIAAEARTGDLNAWSPGLSFIERITVWRDCFPWGDLSDLVPDQAWLAPFCFSRRRGPLLIYGCEAWPGRGHRISFTLLRHWGGGGRDSLASLILTALASSLSRRDFISSRIIE